MRIDIDAFRVLDVLVKQGSYVKAAKSLHKAQSAVNYQIKKLEQHLGVELLNREQYRTELTEAGEVILAEGRKLLSQLTHIEQLASRFNQEWEPKLALVIDGALPMGPILNALKRLAEHEIPTKIQLKVEFLSGVQYCFERNKANLMLVKDFQSNFHYSATVLPSVTHLLVVSPSHALAGMKNIKLLELQQFVELTIEDSALEGSHNDSLQFGCEKVFYLSSFTMKKDALLKGLGFGWMPELLIQSELENGDLVTVDFETGYRFSFSPHLISSNQRPLGRAGQLLTNIILDEYTRL